MTARPVMTNFALIASVYASAVLRGIPRRPAGYWLYRFFPAASFFPSSNAFAITASLSRISPGLLALP